MIGIEEFLDKTDTITAHDTQLHTPFVPKQHILEYVGLATFPPFAWLFVVMDDSYVLYY